MGKVQPRVRRRALQTVVALMLLLAAGAFLSSQRRKFSSRQIRLLPFDSSTPVQESEEALPLERQSQEQIATAMMSWQHGKRVPEPDGGPLYPSNTEEGFITWEQDVAGLNNIRLQVEMLLMLSHLMNRTLVLPEHLDTSIDHMRGVALVADFWDFDHMQGFIRTISMQDYLDRRGVDPHSHLRRNGDSLKAFLRNPEQNPDTVYPKWDAVSDVLVPGGNTEGEDLPPLKLWAVNEDGTPRRQVAYGAEEQAAHSLHFESSENVRLFGSTAFIYFPSRAWQDFYWSAIRDFGQYRSEYIIMASKVVHRIFQSTGGRYNALHFRSTDWAEQYPGWYVNPEQATAKAAQVFGTELPLYLATDSANRTLFAPLIAAFPKVMFLSDFVAEMLPGASFNQHGIVDQLVCSMAQRYMGGFGSTFAGYIHRLRGYRAPALGLDPEVFFTNYPEEDEAWQAALQGDNSLIADAVWWPQEGIPATNAALWAREWSLTWEFPSQL